MPEREGADETGAAVVVRRSHERGEPGRHGFNSDGFGAMRLLFGRLCALFVAWLSAMCYVLYAGSTSARGWQRCCEGVPFSL